MIQLNMIKPKIFKDSTSQVHQESFVLNLLKEKTNGFYLELGGGWAIESSNTYLLESKYGWSGVSFENDPKRAEDYNKIRKNKTLCEDATTFNYLEYLDLIGCPKQIDYLQMDLHPAYNTFKALKQLPLDKYRFSTITYEHNQYATKKNKAMQLESQEIFKSLGYILVAEDILIGKHPYEDWWVDPNVIDISDYEPFLSSGSDPNTLFVI